MINSIENAREYFRQTGVLANDSDYVLAVIVNYANSVQQPNEQSNPVESEALTDREKLTLLRFVVWLMREKYLSVGMLSANHYINGFVKYLKEQNNNDKTNQ
jgi:hypothetical protein